MEIKPELTPPVLRLLDKTFPDSLPVRYVLRNGAAASLLTDNPDNPSYVVATMSRGQDINNPASAVLESFAVATDVDALARVLTPGNILGLVPATYIDAILREWPGTPDPRPDGYVMFYRSLADWDLPPVPLADGAHVRRLTTADAELVNKYWVRGEGQKTLGYVRTLLGTYGGYGVETAEGELVSWVLRYENDSVGMGYTMDKARGKGYVKAGIREVVREQKKAGVETAFWWTHRNNKPILALSASEGFIAAEGLRNILVIRKKKTA
eukprot:m51a1_g7697 putative glycine n-acyltransferase-like protein 2 (268) ;mRNA; f:65488-66620